jgi:farnesyl diphosphate synthase
MAGVEDAQAYASAKPILLEMGEYFQARGDGACRAVRASPSPPPPSAPGRPPSLRQVQDDYLDCYGDPAHIGKIGTDIEDNKCGWLINQALARCSPEQRDVLQVRRVARGAAWRASTMQSASRAPCCHARGPRQDNYARKEPACVARVKAVYEELGLRQVFAGTRVA